LQELLHRLFQTANEAECPWFDTSGSLRQNVASELGSYLAGQFAENR